MRRLVLPVAAVAFLGLGTVASAQPTPRCEIHVLRAPDGVRVAIEEAVRAEKRCDMSLVVRVVPTDKGLYLLAQSPSGRSFEAVVADARAAAAQVAAWSIPELISPVKEAEPVEPLPVAAKDPNVFAVPRVRPPGVTPELSNSDKVSVPPASSSTRSNRFLSAGGWIGDRVVGARIGVDLAGKNGWSLGVALGASEMRMLGSEVATEIAAFDFSDIRTVATAGYTFGSGGAQLRTEVGAGVVHTSLTGLSPFTPNAMEFETSGLFPVGEASVHGIFSVGSSWALSAGPIISFYGQEYRSTTTNEVMVRRELDVSVLAQLRRRL
jgi:hypothetical protein